MENSKIYEVLISQYHAALGMLRDVVEKVPSDQWNTNEYHNPNWQLIYHTIWSARLYLGGSHDVYKPFEKAIAGAESLGGDQEWENAEVEVIGQNSKSELLEFISEIEENLERQVKELPLDSPSGFEWYPYTRFELHLNTIRHIQHHTAQIIERLKEKGIKGFPWWIDSNKPGEWV
ncbi:DinB family protein [Sphingobacterium daejeonense]|uniref:DinB family protein n=1 Tax=Sphingobacterium daejeonense TaxID=371142 RepID=UPI0010C2CFC7|nr:DinB family protein [Sphingobacterium daejeonense]VTQ02366.1 DinB superfamily [Sphingobacterium daejeonense]